MNFDRLRENLAHVRSRIQAACTRVGRDPASVILIVVTKSIPPELLPRLLDLGIQDIGENRPVEGLERLGGLKGVRRHLIGHLQTNKVAKALQWADLIHSVDRPSLIRELGTYNRKPPVFVQINVSGEATKGGYPLDQAEAAVAQARTTLEVLGLMTLAPEGTDARPHFRRLKELATRTGVGNLSMGMSQDFETAVEEGATHVRVGTAIFDGVIV